MLLAHAVRDVLALQPAQHSVGLHAGLQGRLSVACHAKGWKREAAISWVPYMLLKKRAIKDQDVDSDVAVVKHAVHKQVTINLITCLLQRDLGSLAFVPTALVSAAELLHGIPTQQK